MDLEGFGAGRLWHRPDGILSLSAREDEQWAAAPLASYEYALTALGQAMAGREESLAVLLIEIADVWRFQAGLGFAAGGALLQSLCERFAEVLGARGRVLRLSDGRYCAIVRAIRNNGHAVLAAEKLLRTADDVLAAASVIVKPHIFVGIALYPAQATQAEDLFRRAHLAAEAARKRTARLLVYDAACSAEVLAPWELGNRFVTALEAGELSVFYQPKISMRTGRPVGVESLMRWVRDGQIIAAPDVFIPLAGEAGLIQPTTWFGLSNALRMSADLGNLPVAVNITPGMLHHREFLDMIRTATSTWGLHDNLTLEITEGALIADFTEASARLKSLRDMGIRVSIDDFGTGYSSLSYFKKIPADELKIDKSFISGMAEDAADRRLVQTIIDLAAHFKLEVVAEGVEDRTTFDILANMGCDSAQGYFFSPALSLDRLVQWMAQHSSDLREA